MAFGGFQQSEQNTAPMAEINTTPLVDVMLVLLVIFIITAPLMTSAINLDLPNAPAKPVAKKPQTIQIGIDPEGKIFWNQTLVDEHTLKIKMAEAAALKPTPEVHIRADKHTYYASVALVLGQAQAHGLSKIGFITLPTPENK
jgi:biopolymer transport protein ExbD